MTGTGAQSTSSASCAATGRRCERRSHAPSPDARSPRPIAMHRFPYRRGTSTSPGFSTGPAAGGREVVLPGNREYVAGDEIVRPQGGLARGAGGGASPDGEGEDAFRFHLSREEFLDF